MQYGSSRRHAGDVSEIRTSESISNEARATSLDSGGRGNKAVDGWAAARGAVEVGLGIGGMIASGAAMATGGGLLVGAGGMVLSKGAATIGVTRMVGAFTGADQGQISAAGELANPFGAAAAAGTGLLGGTSDQMQFAGKLGALAGNLGTNLNLKAFGDWDLYKGILAGYGYGGAAIGMIRAAGELSNVGSKISLGADIYDLYGDVTGGDKSSGVRAGGGYAGDRSYLGVGNLNDSFGGGRMAGDRSESRGDYAGRGSLLGGRDLNSDFGFDGGSDFGGGSGGDDGGGWFD